MAAAMRMRDIREISKKETSNSLRDIQYELMFCFQNLDNSLILSFFYCRELQILQVHCFGGWLLGGFRGLGAGHVDMRS